MTAEQAELIIVGAGPAGLAAATRAANAGVEVTLIDEQPNIGGQIYRSLSGASQKQRDVLGADYAAGQELFDAFLKVQDRVEHLSQATVWNVTQGCQVTYSQDGVAKVLTARHLILATGAMERPMPFPGWTLPGVMTAGAGQILLKTSGLVPQTDIVLAGSGPLLYLLAKQYMAAGAKLSAIVETTPKDTKWRALRHAPAALKRMADLRKGLVWQRDIKRAGIPHYKHATQLHARGEGKVAALAFHQGGREHVIDCQLLMLHQGVVPSLQITRALQLPHVWDAQALCWRPQLGEFGRTPVDGISVIGDGGGIVGAVCARLQGELAGLDAANTLGHLSAADTTAAMDEPKRALRHYHAIRAFLDTFFAPAPEFRTPSDETLVCRCESITAGTVRACVREGCLGPNQLKAFCRAGMGPCQSRQCALTVAEIIAAERGVSVADVEAMRVRPPLKPVTLGELASLAESDTPYARLD